MIEFIKSSLYRKSRLFTLITRKQECSMDGDQGDSSNLSGERTRLQLLVPLLNLWRRRGDNKVRGQQTKASLDSISSSVFWAAICSKELICDKIHLHKAPPRFSAQLIFFPSFCLSFIGRCSCCYSPSWLGKGSCRPSGTKRREPCPAPWHSGLYCICGNLQRTQRFCLATPLILVTCSSLEH